MTLTRRGRILANIGAWLAAIALGFSAIGWADAAPQPTTATISAQVVDGWAARAKNERAPRLTKFSCNNNTARILYNAGFRGNSLRMAWAIVMRESKGQNLDESSRYFTGALGIFQIQTSAHSGKPWWARSAMLSPDTQSRIVYRYMTSRGTNWRPWGLTPDGRLDATHYRGWSSWQQENWIMKPFRKYYAAYPC
jgi:hypothetical protein